jgi:hypothetical protein
MRSDFTRPREHPTVNLPDHLDLIAAAPAGIQKLRGLILELAVRGKLVPQDPNDEPASELLKRIAKERARLEAEGACRKSKATPLFPLPPLAEQHRIVAKVDELMALCDRLEAEQADAGAAHARLVATLLGTLTQSADAAELAANWQRLAEHFDTLFTTESSLDALKQTILQLAVMGKLVPQDPNDEPASELLGNRPADDPSQGTLGAEPIFPAR